MKLVIFGANGPTGQELTRQALAEQHRPTAVTRNPGRFPLHSPLLTIVRADAMDRDSVARAIEGADAVISTLGVPYGRKPITIYSVGITNIIRGMGLHEVRRLVCVTSSTVPKTGARDGALLGRLVLHPLLRHLIGRTLYDDMQRMEDTVRQSSLDWTIIRPGGLFNTEGPTNDYTVSTTRSTEPFTSRADLAAVLLAEAVEPQHLHQIIEITTHSFRPSPLVFVQEAFRR